MMDEQKTTKRGRPPIPGGSRVSVGVRVRPHAFETLKRLAAKERMPVSSLAALIVEDYIDNVPADYFEREARADDLMEHIRNERDKAMRQVAPLLELPHHVWPFPSGPAAGFAHGDQMAKLAATTTVDDICARWERKLRIDDDYHPLADNYLAWMEIAKWGDAVRNASSAAAAEVYVFMARAAAADVQRRLDAGKIRFTFDEGQEAKQ